LKRRISDVVYRKLVADQQSYGPGGTPERLFRWRGRPHILTPALQLSHPGPSPNLHPRPASPAPFNTSKHPHLTQRGFVMCG
jgi:hypothetical protein